MEESNAKVSSVGLCGGILRRIAFFSAIFIFSSARLTISNVRLIISSAWLIFSSARLDILSALLTISSARLINSGDQLTTFEKVSRALEIKKVERSIK